MPVKEDVLWPYWHTKLLFQEGQIEMQIRSLHQLVAPTRQLRDDTPSLVYDERILSVDQWKKQSPHRSVLSMSIVVENVHTRAVLLQNIVDHGQQILHRLILRHIRDHLQECSGAFVLVFLEELISSRGRRCVEHHNHVELLLVNHLTLEV